MRDENARIALNGKNGFTFTRREIVELLNVSFVSEKRKRTSEKRGRERKKENMKWHQSLTQASSEHLLKYR